MSKFKEKVLSEISFAMVDDIPDLQKLYDKVAATDEHSELNENQRIAINNAKKSFGKGADLYDCAIDMMLYDGLTDKEWAKVTVAFLLWALEQEEEK